jgi:hypothetical protein
VMNFKLSTKVRRNIKTEKFSHKFGDLEKLFYLCGVEAMLLTHHIRKK